MSSDPVTAAVTYLKTQVDFVPEIGIICGSGLGGLAATLTNPTVVKYADIPLFPRTTVHGHAGELVFGCIGDKKVVCMKGRFHYYEGNPPLTVGMPVRVMAALGIRALIVTNAAGGVNPSFRVGDIMLIQDHISLMGLAGVHPLVGPNDDRFGPRFPPQNAVYDKNLRELLSAAATSTGFKAGVHVGTYAGVSGPSYETPHEIQMLRTMGGDSVGMSTVFEVILAAHAGLPVAGISLITNRCLGPKDDWVNPSHQEVLDAVKDTGDSLQKIVTSFVSDLKLDKYPQTQCYLNHFSKL